MFLILTTKAPSIQITYKKKKTNITTNQGPGTWRDLGYGKLIEEISYFKTKKIQRII